MGKAKIQNHLGDGLYLVTYYRDVSDAEAEVKALEKLRVDLEKAIYKPGGYNDQLVDIELELTVISQEFKDASDAWEECAKENCGDESKLMAELLAVGKKKADKIREYMELLAKISQAKAERLNASARIAFLQNTAINLAQEGMEVWCADSPHEEQQPIATGTMVGTIETYGASKIANQDVYGPDQQVNIYPSWQNAAVYSAARDHQTQTIGGQTVATALNNVLEWLWVMAKKPTYEIGKLLSKDDNANVGTVECYGNTLSTGRPDLFPYDGSSSVVLTNIVFQYQNCHSRVFDPNDMVIVSYTGPNRAGAKIIGFASNPVECIFYYLQYSANNAAVYLYGDTSQEVYKGDDGEVIDIQITGSFGFLQWTKLPELTLYDRQYPYRQDKNVQVSLNLRCDVIEVIDFPPYIDMSLDTGVGGEIGSSAMGIKIGDTVTFCPDGNYGSGCSTQSVFTSEGFWVCSFPWDSIPGISLNIVEQNMVNVPFGHNANSYAATLAQSNAGVPLSFSTDKYADGNNLRLVSNDMQQLVCPDPPNQYSCASGYHTETYYSSMSDLWFAAGRTVPADFYVVATHTASTAKRRYGNCTPTTDALGRLVARIWPM